MLDTVETATYNAFGMIIRSDIPMPELIRSPKRENAADMVIEKADLSDAWRRIATDPNKFAVEDRTVMFQISDTAIFSVNDGATITVSPMSGADEHKIRLYLLGTCMGALLMQRRVLPLHGSAIAIDGKAYAIVGDSGAGKSTLASTLMGQGFSLISDDVIAVTLVDRGEPWVSPAYPQQKLWLESLTEFGMETSRFQPIFQRENKFLVPVNSRFSLEPMPLAGVFELVKTEEQSVRIEPIQGLERLHTLYCHTFRQFLLSRLGLREWHFQTTAGLSKQIGLYRLHRPSSGFTAHQLAALILETIDKGEHA